MLLLFIVGISAYAFEPEPESTSSVVEYDQTLSLIHISPELQVLLCNGKPVGGGGEGFQPLSGQLVPVVREKHAIGWVLPPPHPASELVELAKAEPDVYKRQMLVRPISGSAALGVGSELITTYGPDSTIGRTAAVMLGSTETTFYTCLLYTSTHTAGRMSKGVALPAAMRTAATVVGISWMDAVLHTTSMHKLSLATPGVRRLIRRAASSPDVYKRQEISFALSQKMQAG